MTGPEINYQTPICPVCHDDHGPNPCTRRNKETAAMSTPTPGPWKVLVKDRKSKPDRFGRVTETHDVFINGSDGLGSIAKLYVGHEKDAHLIAQAPAMLEALQSCARVAQAWLED